MNLFGIQLRTRQRCLQIFCTIRTSSTTPVIDSLKESDICYPTKRKKCRRLLTSSYNKSKKRIKNSTLENQHKQIAISVTPLHSMSYDDQLKYKTVQVNECLRKTIRKYVMTNKLPLSELLIKNIEKTNGSLCPMEPCLPSPLIHGYRRKDEFIVGRSLDGNPQTVGLTVGKGMNSFCVPVTYLSNISKKHKEISKVFQEFIRSSKFEPYTIHPGTSNNQTYYSSGHWRLMCTRSTSSDESMSYVIFHPRRKPQEVIEEAKEELKNFYLHGPGRLCGISTMFFQPTWRNRTNADIIPFELLYGQPYVTETLLGYKFQISPDSFFQINTSAAEVLYSVIKDSAKLTPNEVILDICCGTGSIGIVLAPNAKRLFGVEIIQDAVNDAKVNAKINGVTNADFICSRASLALKQISLGTYFDPSETAVAVINPGRSGVSKSVIRSIRRCKPIKRLVYVTCRPIGNTLTNFIDLCRPPNEEFSDEAFVPVHAVPVDMFPQTLHCELVVVFER